MWKRICEGALRVVTAISPVFLAACYGPQYYPMDTTYPRNSELVDDGQTEVVRNGRVVDAVTKQGIPGIRVGCMTQAADKPFTFTDENGEFSLILPDEGLCTAFAFDDVDGALTGGKYVSQVLNWCNCPKMTVEMTLSE